MPPLPIVTADARSGAGLGSNEKGGLPRPPVRLSVMPLLHPSPSPVHHQPDQDQPDQADHQQQEYGESVDCRDRGGESCLSQ